MRVHPIESNFLINIHSISSWFHLVIVVHIVVINAVANGSGNDSGGFSNVIVNILLVVTTSTL